MAEQMPAHTKLKNNFLLVACTRTSTSEQNETEQCPKGHSKSPGI